MSWLIAVVSVGAVGFVVHALLPAGVRGQTFDDRLNGITSEAIHLVESTGAVGLLTMTVVEAAKRLAPIRGRFHCRRLERILGKSAMEELRTDGGNQAAKVRDLSWFDVPLEHLIGQINGIAQERLGREDASGPSRSQLVASLIGPPEGSEQSTTPVRADPLAQLELSLDAIQLVLGTEWRRWVRRSSIAVSGLIATGLQVQSGLRPDVSVLLVIVTAVSGGFFAWVARDIVATLERWRR
jgi:hypothetical protein